MKKPKGICCFEGCDNEVRHSVLDCCYTCYRYLLVWRDRSPQAKRERHAQIRRLNDRLEHMMTGGAMPARKKNKPTAQIINLNTTRGKHGSVQSNVRRKRR